MKFNDIIDHIAIEEFLTNHNLGSWDSVEVLHEDAKDIKLSLDFGDDEIVIVNIRRRKGYNGNYRLTQIA